MYFRILHFVLCNIPTGALRHYFLVKYMNAHSKGSNEVCK